MSITSVQNYKVSGAALASNINFEGRIKPESIKIQTEADCFKSQSGAKVKCPLNESINNVLAKYAPRVFMEKYLNEGVIQNAIETNPKISELLIENGIEPKIYIENIKGKNRNHFRTTYDSAKKAAGDISKKEYSTLLEASLLHDIGKSLIPASILNKPGKLNEDERKIVDLHAELGAEILKTTNINKKVIEAVLLHHTDCESPLKKNNLAAQILSVADVYSALKEERPYKPKMSDEKVKNIMQSDKKLNQHFAGKLVVKNSTVPIFA